MAEMWGDRARVARRMGRHQIAKLEAQLEEERRVARLIAHLRHWTPSAQTPKGHQIRLVPVIPLQRTASPSGLSAPARWRR